MKLEVRHGTAGDGPAMAALWNEVRHLIADYWPGGTMRPQTAETMERLIQKNSTYLAFDKDELLGFFLTRPSRLHAVDAATGETLVRSENAEREVWAIITPGVPNFAKLIKGLYRAWVDDLFARGVEYGWGTLPPNAPARYLAWLRQSWKLKEGMDPQNGWLVFYDKVPEARGRLK